MLEKREILFRGQIYYDSVRSELDKDETDWIEGYPFKANNDDWHITATNKKDKFGCKLPTLRVKTETVTQYTGIKDCEDRRIFEGDIVEYYGIHYCVRYTDFGAAFVASVKPDGGHSISGHTFKESRIIGNIFENPELLDNK